MTRNGARPHLLIQQRFGLFPIVCETPLHFLFTHNIPVRIKCIPLHACCINANTRRIICRYTTCHADLMVRCIGGQDTGCHGSSVTYAKILQDWYSLKCTEGITGLTPSPSACRSRSWRKHGYMCLKKQNASPSCHWQSPGIIHRALRTLSPQTPRLYYPSSPNTEKNESLSEFTSTISRPVRKLKNAFVGER